MCKVTAIWAKNSGITRGWIKGYKREHPGIATRMLSFLKPLNLKLNYYELEIINDVQ
jgi:hypothetical protein